MRIKIWASASPRFPDSGPYKALHVIERDAPYSLGEVTHYGPVILIPPPIPPFMSDRVEQSVIVKADPATLNTWPDGSIYHKPPSSYDKIEIGPIYVDTVGWSETPRLTGPYEILPSENLTIENVSHLITPTTFSLWKSDCFVSKRTSEDLESVDFAIVHRYSSPQERDIELDKHSSELIDSAATCLALIRPTRKSRARRIPGVIKADGTFDPHGFTAQGELADVPEIQKLFAVREQDISLLTSVLPEFIQLYQKDDDGKVMDGYEPLRMAVQLYGEAYALSYWKARHILWWSAIEALYGNNEDVAMARIYALFGNKNLVDGYKCPIYEKGDIPSCYFPSPDSMHKLGEMVPLIYSVRNASAHGQRVPDIHFGPVPHPFGPDVASLETLAEAATFIVRKTVIEILKRKWRDEFKDRDAREHFWLYQYGLDKHQSKKRLREMKDLLGLP